MAVEVLRGATATHVTSEILRKPRVNRARTQGREKYRKDEPACPSPPQSQSSGGHLELKEVHLEKQKEELASHGGRKTLRLVPKGPKQAETPRKLREGLKSWLDSELHLFFFFFLV